ncbi:MAG: SlyX family protein [Pseudomonadales bacterium]|nr:SlyX family protein [Pseudomonadales bacterium]
MTDVEQKLIDLEERLAFQDHTISKLDDALADQQKQLLDILRQVQLLAEQLRKLETDSHHRPQAGTPQYEKPPHY